jgi:hypothetical protein
MESAMLTMHVPGQYATAFIIFLYICTCIGKYPHSRDKAKPNELF